MLVLDIAAGLLLGVLGLMVLFAWPQFMAVSLALAAFGALCCFVPPLGAVLGVIAAVFAVRYWFGNRSLDRSIDGARRKYEASHAFWGVLAAGPYPQRHSKTP
ncbi:MAG TPA: hypothetical protein VMF67_15770 [Rhizomicrobium sp.]|nr:hypothetical protein [Rhizomicrobium sp.]